MNYIERLKLQTEIATLPLEMLTMITSRQEWLETARPDQLPPDGDWSTWILKAGRGAGKTRSGAEEVSWRTTKDSIRVALVCPTNNDVRKTCYEGESGLLAVVPKELIVDYNRTSMEMWVKPLDLDINLSGSEPSYIVGYSAEEPERLRGPQHHFAWCDELAAWRYLLDTWDMLEFTMRLGDDPQILVSTTPKPSGVLRDLLKEPTTVMTEASTFDNIDNLPTKFLQKMRDKYEGTRLGRQELYAELLGDNPYAFWNSANIEENRVRNAPEMKRIVVAIDPPITTGEDADECGIVVAGEGTDGHWYVMDDASAQGLSPTGWATEAIRRYYGFCADCIVAEVNQGGDMVETVILNSDDTLNVKQVRASRGKVVRAEPIAALYEQNRVHHVGQFGTLEDQMCDFTTDFDKKIMGYSPDRVDALVWALTELALESEAGAPKMRSL